MTNLPKPVYHQLVITASSPATEIWLGDDNGHLVQKAVGELRTNLLAGDYTVEFELGGQIYPVQIHAATRYTEGQIEAGHRAHGLFPSFMTTSPRTQPRQV